MASRSNSASRPTAQPGVSLEHILVHTLLRRPETFRTLAPGFTADCLHLPTPRRVFEIISAALLDGIDLEPNLLALRGGVNPATLKQLKAGGRDYQTLGSLHEASQTLINQKLSRNVRAIGLGMTQAASKTNGSDLREAVSQNLELFWVDNESALSPVVPHRQQLKSYLRKMRDREARDTGGIDLSSGFAGIDRLTLGWRAGQLILVAGRPGMGKSCLGLNFVEAALRQGKHCMLFSLEMTCDEVNERMLSAWGDIDIGRMRSGGLTEPDVVRLSRAVQEMSECSIVIDDNAGITIEEIMHRTRMENRLRKVDLVVIDYVQLCRLGAGESAMNSNQKLTEISHRLLQLAKDVQTPVIAMTQINRAVESRSNKRPMISDLRESGTLEQDAHIILLLYRDDYYDKDSDAPGVAELNIGKNRSGQAGGVIRLAFQGQLSQFAEPAG